MRKLIGSFLVVMMMAGQAAADTYRDTVAAFKAAEQSGEIIDNAYGYAVFPTVGKGGVVFIGGAYGEGRVYQAGRYMGDSTLTQASLGPQLGGQAYSQLICFKNKAAFDNFTSGSFEFGAQASVVALTAGASAEASTKGSSVGASVDQSDGRTHAIWYKDMAVFTLAKGGLMYEVSVGGQKFDYQPK